MQLSKLPFEDCPAQAIEPWVASWSGLGPIGKEEFGDSCSDTGLC